MGLGVYGNALTDYRNALTVLVYGNALRQQFIILFNDLQM